MSTKQTGQAMWTKSQTALRRWEMSDDSMMTAHPYGHWFSADEVQPIIDELVAACEATLRALTNPGPGTPSHAALLTQLRAALAKAKA
jgi:hypothetical protein